MNKNNSQIPKPIIGVYGVTSVGKSTFLNALLKSSEFKVGLGETTKNIHIIQHKNNDEKVKFNNISLNTEYIFKDIELLKNFTLVDVPGTNKSFSDKDIENIVSKLDVIVWIFDIQSDISDRDLNFLNNVILKNMLNTVVILNKIDSGIEDMDFDELDEFIIDVKSRKDKIIDFFENYKARQLLVSVLPISAKKLLAGVNKNQDIRFKKQHKELENILIKVSQSAFIQKQIFRDNYDKIKSNVVQEIELKANKLIKKLTNNIKYKLKNISDEDIMNDYTSEDIFLNTNDLVISHKYRKELINISKEIYKGIN